MRSPYDTTVEEALSALDQHDGPVLVDLDETLYLRNTTEDFIDTAIPSTLAWFVLKLLELLHPWRWTGGLATRDVWRVRTICLLFPWTLIFWRYRVKGLAANHANQALLKKLACRSQPPAIATLGFKSIVTPLIHAMGLGSARIIAMSQWNIQRRADGKLKAVNESLGERVVRDSLLITDSMDDADILAVCHKPLRVIWPQARFVGAFQSTYIPGQYLTRVKRPGQQYLYRVIIRDDFVFWVLGSIGLALNPLPHLIGLALLAISFWAIYEWGYFDNDQIGARHEKDPHLSDAFIEGSVKFSTPLAWAWATVCGIAALWLLRWPAMPVATDYLAWAGVLLSVFVCYLLYNRLNKPTRIWLYGFLRLLRVAAFVAVVPVTVIGAVALSAYTISKWIPYLNYRTVGGDWDECNNDTIRLMLFVFISVLIAGAVGSHIFWSFSAWILLGWHLFKARREMKSILGQAHRIDRAAT